MTLVEVEREEHVATVTLASPKTRNALSPAMMDALADALRTLDADDEIRCIVVTGQPGIFAAGADIRWLAQATHEQMMRFGAGRWPDIRGVQTPLVAAVEGRALGGGCELALGCDVVVAAATAEFGLPEVGLGILPGAGGTQRVTRTAGRLRAIDMILLGRRLSAAQACDWGLVTRVADAGRALETATEIAQHVAALAPMAVRLIKQAIRAAEELPLAAGLDHERRLFELALSTHDRQEGMAAFLQKRQPRWTTDEEGADE